MRFKKITAVVSTAALVGLGVIGLATSSSAHTGDLNATAVCNPDTGKYDVTYKLTISNTSLQGDSKWSVGTTTFAHTPTSNSDLPGTVQGTVHSTGAGVITLGTISIPGSSTQAPWAYAFTTWSDNFKKGSDGGDIDLAGTCGDNDDTKKVDVCHATGSESNPYTKINISVAAFFQAGHIDHSGDIYEAFDYVKHGVSHHVDAKGDTSLLQYKDCVKPVNKIVPDNPVVKDKCGTENDHYGLPSTDGISYTRTPNASTGPDILATITADNTVWGTLPSGWVKVDSTHAVYAFTNTQWDTTPCEVPPTHITVSFPDPTQPTCTEDGSLPNKPADTDQVSWAWDGNTLTATAKTGYVIDGQASKTYDEPGKAIGNQSSDPNAPCFVPPPPQVCTPSGDWYTEDIAPTVTADGWLFSGPHAQAVDYYHPVSGNLQGLTAQSITYSNVSGYHPSLVFEVYRNGTTGYATIVAEPYQNGWVAGQSGTFTVTQSTKVWTSKIASGPGSQSDPIALSDMAALFPLNQLISEGIHLGTNSTADQHAVVTSLEGCAPVSTVPNKPEPITGQDSGSNEPVCVLDDGDNNTGDSTVESWTQNWKQEYVWDDESHSYILGDKVYEDKVYTTSDAAPDANCPPPSQVIYRYDYNDECTAPADGTATETWYEQTGTQPYVFMDGAWVLGDEDWNGEWTVIDVETFPSGECPPPPVPDTVTTEVSQPVCGDTTITTTTTTISYTWEFQGGEESVALQPTGWVKVAGEPVVTTSTRPITNEEIDALECPLVPGGIQAQCVGNIPYLAYNLDLPAGFTADSSKPVTITFHKGSNTYTLPGTYPLSGKVLWPGANVSPAQWPGWTLDGTQPTDDPPRFGWTREGVSVTFEVNPSYTTTVAYPEATSACANPPVVPPTPITPHHLASTGVNMAGAGLAALVLIGLGSALTIARKRYGNQH